MTVTRQYLADQIVTATDNSDGEYNVDGIVQAIIDQYGYVDADSIDADAFWSLVLEHLVPIGITREQAEQAFEAIKLQFALFVGDAGSQHGPKLIQNWDWMSTVTPTAWAVVWEEGPYEWTMRVKDGGVDEEATILAQDIEALKGVTLETPAALLWPEGVVAEPINSWSLSLYLI